MKLILILIAAALTQPTYALPDDAAAIKDLRDRKISDVNAAYVRELEKCKTRAMNDGDLSGATEIEAEIEATCAPTGTPDMSTLIGTWRRTKDGMVFKITSATAGVWNNDTPFDVSWDPEKRRVILKATGWVDELQFPTSAETITGWDGKSKRYQLVRID